MCIYVWGKRGKKVKSEMSTFEVIKECQKVIKSIVNMVLS
jgi:predicted DNA-binding WGR domain protein